MTTATNTAGAITNAVSAPKQPPKITPATIMSNLLSGNATKKMLEERLKEQAGAFTASLVDLYRSDNLLQQCPPGEVLAEALRAVSFGLPIAKALGFVWIVPRRSHGEWHPTFQLGYKGMIQLAIRSGEYKYINADAVYEGEIVTSNRLTGAIEIMGAPTNTKVIGYFAYFCTKGGFEKSIYMTVDQVKDYANKYSDSYKSGAKIWKDEFDSMATKTCLRRLLSHYGLFSITSAESRALSEQIAADDTPSLEEKNELPVVDVDAETGEVKEGE